MALEEIVKGVKKYYRYNYEAFSTRTNMHGFGELYITNTCQGKLFWTISLAVCLSITTYQITLAARQYIFEPYITVIEKITDEELTFPRLRVCYKHWIYWADFNKALTLNFTKESTLYGLSYWTEIYTQNDFDVTQAQQEFLYAMDRNNFSKISQFYEAIAKPPPVATFNEIDFVDDILCYSINSDKIKQIIKSSASYSSRIGKFPVMFKLIEKPVVALDQSFITQMEHDCYLSRFISQQDYSTLRSDITLASNKISIQLPTLLYIDEDILEIRKDDIVLAIHSHATVSKWQSGRKFNCTKDMVSVNSNYTCQLSCFQNIKQKNCPCSWFSEMFLTEPEFENNLCRNKIHFLSKSNNSCISLLSQPSSPRVPEFKTLNCTTNEDMCCYVENNEYEECNKHCIPGCTIWNYYLGYIQRLKMGTLKRFLRKTEVNVLIYFPLTHDVLSTNEIVNLSFERFVGNIGGLLGLWTGASILSIF